MTKSRTASWQSSLFRYWRSLGFVSWSSLSPSSGPWTKWPAIAFFLPSRSPSSVVPSLWRHRFVVPLWRPGSCLSCVACSLRCSLWRRLPCVPSVFVCSRSRFRRSSFVFCSCYWPQQFLVIELIRFSDSEIFTKCSSSMMKGIFGTHTFQSLTRQLKSWSSSSASQKISLESESWRWRTRLSIHDYSFERS